MNTKPNSPTVKTWHFDFIVERISKHDAEWLLEQIAEMVENAMPIDAKMAGGFHEETEGDDVQEEPE